MKNHLSSLLLALKVWAHGLSSDNWELTESQSESQSESESQTSDRYLKNTIALDVQWQPFIAGVVTALSTAAGGESSGNSVFRSGGCAMGGWVGV